MKRKYTKIIIFLLGISIITGSFLFFNQKDNAGLKRNESFVVEIETTMGQVNVQLLNETPLHRDNFVKLAEDGFYDGLLFHRIIYEFVIQIGDPTTTDFSPEAVKEHGEHSVDYKIDAEIFDDIHHFRGALGAARDDNPEKKSSGSQIYFVQSPASYKMVNYIQGKIKKGEISEKLAEEYMEKGGTPFLDGNYTVFGYVLTGMRVVDDIAAVECDDKDYPLQPSRVKILSTEVKKYSKREIKKLYKDGK